MKISALYNPEISHFKPHTRNLVDISESSAAASRFQYISDEFNWLAPIFPSRRDELLFTVPTPPQAHSGQISLIIKTLEE